VARTRQRAIETVRRNSDSDPTQRYLAALVEGDEEAAAAAIKSVIADAASISDVYINLLTPAMTRIGELWRKKTINVAQQKLATQITLGQMDRLRSLGAAKRKWPHRVLVCCAQGEMHSTGARMLADLLRLEGWSVDFLGADVPTADAVAMVKSRKPHILAVSVTMESNLKYVRALTIALRKLAAPPKVVVGGQASGNLKGWKALGLDFNVAADLTEGLTLSLAALRSARPKTDLENYLKELGQRIRELRTRNEQTQAELAASAGLNRAYIVSVERGKQNITMGVVIKIANALGVSTDQLLSA
jgi:methanogenic corrinoid protein MtbC1/DNA-binding XRE family transcriptional regulator